MPPRKPSKPAPSSDPVGEFLSQHLLENFTMDTPWPHRFKHLLLCAWHHFQDAARVEQVITRFEQIHPDVLGMIKAAAGPVRATMQLGDCPPTFASGRSIRTLAGHQEASGQP